MSPATGTEAGTTTGAEAVLLSSASDTMRSMLSRAMRVARSPDIPVLIQGESGVGKEIVAHHIHQSTETRRQLGFLKIACAGAAERAHELEAELFGRSRTTPRGPRGSRPGAIERAGGGTLFLNDVGELTPALQSRVLVALETEARTRARVISATSRDLAKEARAGRFRPDLYHRLSAFQLNVPPLRRRREDILPLTRFFLEHAATRLARPAPKLSPEAARLLVDYDFPGNVRELKNVIEQALIVEPGPVIKPPALPLDSARRSLAGDIAFFAVPLGDDDQPPALAEVERRYLERVLTFAKGNRSLTMRLLKVSYPTVTRKIAEYGIRVAGSDLDNTEGED